VITLNILSFSSNLALNKRKIVASGLIAFLTGALLSGILLNLTQISPFYSVSGQPLLTFASYEELVDFVNTTSNYPYYSSERGWFFSPDLGVTTQESAVSDYSTTNIQVAGVDEADIVKTDGEYLYLVSNQSFFILKAYPPEDLQIISQIKFNGTLHEIFINGDKLVIFGSSSHETVLTQWESRFYWPYTGSKTFIKVYDVSNKTSPTSTRNTTLDGFYFNSRMIENYVYTVINEPTLLNESKVNLPIIYSNDRAMEVHATDISYSNITDYAYTFTTIVAINVQDDAEEPTYKAIVLGATRSMYVSLSNIYITIPGQRDAETGVEKTLIYRIHVEANNIECEASGAALGNVLNQFSMDEYHDYFRIATTIGSLWGAEGSRNNVYVLNMSLSIVGKLVNLAPGEKIYSARFMGDRCYLVTFRKVDPLFVIDLQNPEKPEVLGQLKITGYSNYLHPYDENHVIGIGKETVASDSGNFAWYQGVKISLFDVSDVSNPQEIDKDEIGDRGTDSPALSDHKAFLFDKEKQLLVIPVLIAEIDESKYPGGEPPSNAYGDYVWQGAYVYTITLDGFELKGNITHIENGVDLQSSYYSYSPYAVKRSLYIDNVIYTVSDKKVKMNSLETLDELWEIELP